MYTRLWFEAVDYIKSQINAEGLYFNALVKLLIHSLCCSVDDHLLSPTLQQQYSNHYDNNAHQKDQPHRSSHHSTNHSG